MRNTICLAAALVLTLGLSACSKSDSPKLDADKAAAEILGKPAKIEAGSYVAAMECADKSKNEALPKLSMIFNLASDGTYTEDVVILEKDCKEGCSLTAKGTYTATTSQFKMNQAESKSEDGRTLLAAQTIDFSVVAITDSVIVLENDSTDNPCEGKSRWTLMKK